MPGQFAPSAEELERLAHVAIDRLPPRFRDPLGEIAFLVEELADDETLAALDIDDPFALTGVYSGRPFGETAQTGDPPTVIRLFRRAILDEWIDDGEELGHLVQHIVVHEVGHHFGLTDADMHALED